MYILIQREYTHRSSFANITNVVPSLQCISWFKESKHTHRSTFANITNVVPSLQCIFWFKESKHTHRSSFANIINVVPSLQCIFWFKESKHTHISSFANITNAVPWFKESKHRPTHRSSFVNITNVVPSLWCVPWFKESINILVEAVLPTLLTSLHKTFTHYFIRILKADQSNSLPTYLCMTKVSSFNLFANLSIGYVHTSEGQWSVLLA